jgi:hypothetical protein
LSPVELIGDMNRPASQRTSSGEVFLIGCSLASLVLSCILWSPHKQAWMDEIFTWKEVSDLSLLHLYHAIERGADGGMPVFYTTAWVWGRAFGTSVLTLRLYSCIAMCGALLITWRTIRRFYGVFATGFGVLTMWGTSAVLLDQNCEARFYGLYMLAVSIAVNIYARLITEPAPRTRLLLLTTLCQAGLVLSHILGLIYSGLILLALAVFDGRRHRLRLELYFRYAVGWLALLIWIPAIRASMAVGKPHGWIEMPSVRGLLTAYLFQNSSLWLSVLKGPSHRLLFSFFILELLRSVPLSRRTNPDPESALLLVAYSLLSAPLILFVLSRLITPVFVPRYFLPSGIGLAIVLAAFADRLGADSNLPRWEPRLLWVSIILFLMISPVLSTLALQPVSMDSFYLDVQRLDNVVPPDTAVVVNWANDFLKIMRYSHGPLTHYYFMLDWPAALVWNRQEWSRTTI